MWCGGRRVKSACDQTLLPLRSLPTSNTATPRQPNTKNKHNLPPPSTVHICRSCWYTLFPEWQTHPARLPLHQDRGTKERSSAPTTSVPLQSTLAPRPSVTRHSYRLPSRMPSTTTRNPHRSPASSRSSSLKPILGLVALALLALELVARYLQRRHRRNHSTQQIRFPCSSLAVRVRSLRHCPHRSRSLRQISHHPAAQTRSLPRSRTPTPLHQLRTFSKPTTQLPFPRLAGPRAALNTSVKLLPRMSRHCPKAWPKYRSWTTNLLRPTEDLPAIAFRGKVSRSGKRM